MSQESPAPGAAATPVKGAGFYHAFGMVPFIGVHVLALVGGIVYGVSTEAVLLAVALYVVRLWGVTAGYHRYFAHRAYKTSRVFQFLLAFLAQTTSQKGALWWAAHHRVHHKLSDQPGDVHSPILGGFYHAHLGWLFDETSETRWDKIQDFAKYPELVWLNRYWMVPPVALGVACYLLGGPQGLFIGFFASTVFTWHGTFFINSLAHVVGKRRYPTTDHSRNYWLLAILTHGEGWHNNHHHYQSSARNGFYWYEWDPTYYVLVVLSWFGIVWDLRPVPERVLEEGRRLDAEAKARGHALPLPVIDAKQALEGAKVALEETKVAFGEKLEETKAALAQQSHPPTA
ncbi:MAG: acyl-CoA desaturase [Polyangiales bacterium]